MSNQYNACQNQAKTYYPSNANPSVPAPTYLPMEAYQVLSQPMHGYKNLTQLPQQAPMNTYLRWSICNTIFFVCAGTCAIPFFLPALIYSCRAKDFSSKGKYEEAHHSAECSRIWNIIATIFTIICILAAIIFVFTALVLF